MIALFAGKVVRQFLLEAKFLTAAVLVALLFGLSTLISVEQQRQAMSAFQKDVTLAQERSSLDSWLVRGPHPLGFVTGSGGDLPRLLTAGPRGVEAATFEGAQRSFLAGVEGLDWIYITAVVMSLLAIFVSYDVVTREREDGTLRLILAQSVRRSSFLIGSVLGLLATLLLPLVLGVLVGLVMVQISGVYEMQPQHFAAIALLTVLSALYLAFFVSLSVLVSSLCRYSSTALLWLIFFWVAFVVVLPSDGGILASLIEPPPQHRDEVNQLAQLEASYQPRVLDYYSQVRQIVDASTDDAAVRASLDRLRDRIVAEQAQQIQEKNRLISAVHEDFARRRLRHLSLSRTSTLFSPAVLVREALERLITAGPEDYRRFVQDAHSYQRAVLGPILRAQQRHASEARPRLSWITAYSGFEVKGVPEWTYAGIAPDRDLIPTFTYQRPGAMAGLLASLGGIGALVLLCGVSFVLSLYGFARYDVR